MREVGRLLAPVLLAIAGLIVACFGLAGRCSPRRPTSSLLDAYLATTPGGLYAVLAAAFGAGADTTFILAVQTLRLLVMVLLAPVDRAPYRHAAMSSVFVTGASGFLGRAIADRYRAAGAAVRGVDLVADPALDVVAGDVGAPGAWQDHAAGCDLVVHTAAVVTLQPAASTAVYRANVLGTAQRLDAAERGDARALPAPLHRRHLRLRLPGRRDGARPVQVTGLPYGDTKVAAEQLLLQRHAEGRRAGHDRPAGRRLRPAVARLGDAALRADPRAALRRCPRAAIFSPVYVDDLRRRHRRRRGQRRRGGPGADAQRRRRRPEPGVLRRRTRATPGGRLLARARARRMLAATSRPAPRGEINAFAARYLLRRGTYSIAKARELIGYAPRVTVEDGIERTLRWLTS